MDIRGKKILVFGLARSGIGAANLLAYLGAEVTVTDRKSKEELKGFVQRLSPSVRLSLGGHPEGIFIGIDSIVVSPGVPLDIQPLRAAREKGIKVIGELELAYQVISSKLQVASSKFPKFLAVTGTNGKSTTTTLLGLMMRRGGFNTIVGGNIGNALTEEIYKAETRDERRKTSKDSNSSLIPHPSFIDYIVAEVSSFQLESVDKFRPRGATILNITPDHLDRYHSMEEYRDAKAEIFLNQQEDDFLILNADDPEVMKVESEKLKLKSVKPNIFYFSRKHKINGAYLKNGDIYFNLPDVPSTFNLQPSTFKIKGVHNLENAMAASAMALLAKCPAEAVANTLKEFHGLEHRLEFVREIRGVSYINDSKGTNVGAVIKSLESFTGSVILIAGGRDKAGDFSVLRPFIKDRVKAIVLIGEAKEKIKKSLGDMAETKYADDLEEAVTIAKGYASKGDVVLLSPACASFDMFRDFEDRGSQFKKLVMELN